MTIGTPNGWNEYARLVLGQLDSLTKEVQGLRDGIARLSTSLAIVQADQARQRDDLAACGKRLIELDEKRERTDIEMARRSGLVALATAVITSIVIGVVTALLSGGTP